MISYLTRLNLYLKWFGIFKIPLVFFVNPKILQCNDHLIRVKIRLGRKTRNHLGSMYFGVLATGADVTGGILAMSIAQRKQQKISMVFKSVAGEFLKRPEHDVEFVCKDTQLIESMLDESKETGQRINKDIEVIATCPETFQSEPVARFTLTLSIKHLG